MAQNGTQITTPESDIPDISQQPVEGLLTARQLAALPYLVASPSLSDGARLADIGRTTLYRWLTEPDFRYHLERLRSDAADLARTELQGLMLKGVLVLADAMESADASIRLRAARAALYIGLRAIDLKELGERLDHLDDAFALMTSRPDFRGAARI